MPLWRTGSSPALGTRLIFIYNSLSFFYISLFAVEIGLFSYLWDWGNILIIFKFIIKMTTNESGKSIELRCILKFIENGFQCSIPYGNDARYDFIVDLKDLGLIRVQCKKPTVIFNYDENYKLGLSLSLRSTHYLSGGISKTLTYRKSEIDYFATIYEDSMYLIPIEISEGKRSITLRFIPPLNNQKNYLMAEDFTFQKILGLQEVEEMEYRIVSSMRDKDGVCDICGKPIYHKSKHCSNCEKRLRRESRNIPEKDELKTLIRTKSFLEVGRLYKVSDNSVRKWCKRYNLPFRKTEINNISDEDWGKL